MSIKYNERYPGRFNNPTSSYPQGSFKNRTAPNAQDGSYLEQDWMNDIVGLLGRLLTVAGITANGNVDTALSSQYYDALFSILSPGRLMGAPQIITATGTYTPTTGCKLAIVELVGGGGGGGGCYLADSSGASAGGGGGSGAYTRHVFLNPVATSVTIGAGGTVGTIAANTTPSPAGSGGNTIFGSIATAPGGFGGLSAGWAIAVGTTDTGCANGGQGGVLGTGTFTTRGNPGGLGLQLKVNGTGGQGASSKLGNGGHYMESTYTTVAPTWGGGGVSCYRASAISYPGTGGASGVCIVWEYF